MAKPRVVIATPSIIDQVRLEKALLSTAQFDVAAVVGDLSQAYVTVEEMMPEFVLIAAAFGRKEEYQCMDALFRAVEARVVFISANAAHGDDGESDHLTSLTIHSRMAAGEILTILNAREKPKSAYLSQIKPPPHSPHRRHTGPTRWLDRIILIGASTGGIDALTSILPHFPKDCPPVAIVQHTGQNFSETLARLLDRHCQAEVTLAKSGLEMLPGRVCLAGGIDGHLHFSKGKRLECLVTRGPATSGHSPSIDEMFQSALPFAPKVIAVLLTGMGRDGAAGLLALRKAGAVTIGQNQESSVVYGMPRVAHEIGAVQHQMALADIGPAIMQLSVESRAIMQGVGR